MPDYTIKIECPNGHFQKLVIKGLGRQWAEEQAGLLDGTSPMYAFSPIGTPSVIGKCGICGTQIRCTVSEVQGEKTPIKRPDDRGDEY